MTNFHALKLSEKINTEVIRQAEKYCIDLNGIDVINPNMIIVGLTDTGLDLVILQHKTKGLEGVRITPSVNGYAVECVNLIGESL